MAEQRQTIKITPDIRELRGLLKALNAMYYDSQHALKDEVQSISAWTATNIQQAAFGFSPMPKQAAIVAATVRANRDRLPTVTIGGSKGRVSGGANAGQLLFGNEFGGNRNAYGSVSAFKNGGYKFPPRTSRSGRGNTGYCIFPTLKAMQPEITHKWKTAVEKVLSDWSKGPGGGI
jgi:hypothetical protein